MSSIALTPNAAGTATFTIAAPGTNTNRTITLPDAATTLVGTDATQTLTNKTIDASQLTGDVAAARITNALNASGSAPIYACRAWVNFNGTLAAASMIQGSGNVSSITDNGTGNYTVNFTTAMPNATYAVVTSGHASTNLAAAGRVTEPYNLATTSVTIATAASSSGSVADNAIVTVAIFC